MNEHSFLYASIYSLWLNVLWGVYKYNINHGTGIATKSPNNIHETLFWGIDMIS